MAFDRFNSTGEELQIKWWPFYSWKCHCSVEITGTSENGLAKLIDKHIAEGRLHYDLPKEEE